MLHGKNFVPVNAEPVEKILFLACSFLDEFVAAWP